MPKINDFEMSSLAISISPRNTITQKSSKKIIELSMDDTISVLRYLESRECRKVMSKDEIDIKRKNATEKFRNLIMIKENLNS
jgi:hypothetical protein